MSNNLSNLISCRWVDCDAKFEEENQVYLHLIKEHAVTGKSSCLWRNRTTGRLCNVVFKHRNMLKDHAPAHFSNIVRPFKCDICNDSFRSSGCVREALFTLT